MGCNSSKSSGRTDIVLIMTLILQIAHFEWEHLEKDQDHINYLVGKLYRNSSTII